MSTISGITSQPNYPSGYLNPSPNAQSQPGQLQNNQTYPFNQPYVQPQTNYPQYQGQSFQYYPPQYQTLPMQQPQYPQASPPSTVEKYSTGSGVVINITNPVGTQNGVPLMPSSPPPLPQQPSPPPMPSQNQPVPFPAAQNLDKKAEDKKDNKEPIKPLTDDYIKSIDNYLKNDKPEVRKQGALAILRTFKTGKDDNKIRTDQALTNLLNRTLQDPKSEIRLIALGVISGNYAEGDNKTIQILKNMQQEAPINPLVDQSFKYTQMDAESASKVLMEKAEHSLNVRTTDNTPPAQQQPQQGQNLNFMAG